MRQASGEAAGRSGSGLQADRRTRGGLLIIGLTLFGFVITKRLDRSGHGARAIFGERFTRQNNVVLALFDGSTGAAIVRRPILKSASIFASALRRRIFRGRQVAAAAALSLRTPIPIPVAATTATSAAAPSKTSPATTTSAIAATISTTVSAAVISLRAIVADARRIVARRIVAGSEILRGGSVRFRLALVEFAAFGNLAFAAGITFVVLGCAVKFFG